jgi:hypothetical protein
MPRTLKFYGASDDLFEIEGTKRGEPDEIGCYASKGVFVKVANEHAGCFVAAQYGTDGIANVPAWMIGVQPLEEGIPIPDWSLRIGTADNGYSTLLTMEVPDDVQVSEVA